MYKAYLYHHGIKGQKWGVRRFQNEDGSYTNAGQKRKAQNVNETKKKKSADRRAKVVISTVAVASIVAGVLAAKKFDQHLDRKFDREWEHDMAMFRLERTGIVDGIMKVENGKIFVSVP